MHTINGNIIVTIDVERDYGPNWQCPSEISYQNIVTCMPKVLSPLFLEFGIQPTYLVSPEVILEPESCAVIASLQNGEIGAHLHGEYVCPHPKVTSCSGNLGKIFEMQSEYEPEIELAKISNLVELIQQQLGVMPTTFRAGRFGIGHNTGRWLKLLGFQADTSVTPHVHWPTPSGRHDLDFRTFPEIPYRIAENGDIWKSGDSNFLEVPITILAPGKIQGIDGPIWFRPSYHSSKTLTDIVRIVAEEVSNGYNRPLVMMFHSNELQPGASPYTTTQNDVNIYLDKLRYCFEAALQFGFTPCTIKDYYKNFITKHEDCLKNHQEQNLSLKYALNKENENNNIDTNAHCRISIPCDIVDSILDKYNVQPWFKYIYRERCSRWDVVEPCSWIESNIALDAPILSVGCGVGFNLFWLSEHGFKNLYGFDIDFKAIKAGSTLAKGRYPLHLWVDNGISPGALPDTKFTVVELLNWTMLIKKFPYHRVFKTYYQHISPKGFLIIDAIDSAYNEVENNQYLTSDWNKPVLERKKTEYLTRISHDEICLIASKYGFELTAVIDNPQIIPKKVYIFKKIL